MATTTNFGWETPDDTDLVKDGALAIRTLGSAIDTSLVDLKGGTTGQVLAKNSNTDMDFVWATASSGAANWSIVNSGGTSLTSATTITVSGISGADKIMVLVNAASTVNAGADIGIRLNTDTGSNYNYYGFGADGASSYSSGIFFDLNGTSNNILLGGTSNTSQSSALSGYGLFTGCNSSGVKVFQSLGGTDNGGGTGNESFILGGYYNSSSVITSISIYSANGNFDNGTVYVYTSA